MSEASQSRPHARWHGTSPVVFIPQWRRQALFGHIRQARGPLLHELARQQEGRSMAGQLLPAPGHIWIEIPPQDAGASVSGYRTGKSASAMARQ